MTRDEAKQLLGGYATGSLTESERKALFEAALDDQELFEALAGEQDLKEILALPGAKERLAAAVTTAGATTTMSAPEEKKKPAWWLFALAGVASVGLLVWITTSKKTEAPVEVASQAVEKADTPLPEPPVTSPALENAVREARKETNESESQLDKDSFARRAAKTSGSTDARKSSAKESSKVERADAGQQGKILTAPLAATAPPPPPPAKSSAVGGFAAGTANAPVGAADAAVAAEGRQQLAQGRAAAVKPAAAARPDAPPVRAGSLTYVLTGRGSLKVTPAVSGSLEVTANDRHIIGWDPVVADSTVEMPVPSGVDSLTLRFAIPGQQPQVVQIPIRQ